MSEVAEGMPMAKVQKWRCKRGFTTNEPAVGFMQAAYWQLWMIFGVLESRFRSYQCSYSRCCRSSAIADCVLYGSTSGRFRSSTNNTSRDLPSAPPAAGP